ncbi:MAG TPA: hypothetical protein VFA98_09425, partial [Thermoanaerobaculia bacterium]|nr:hypothetical protein [Thermoanaerobaculia bacterium]
PAGRRFKLTGYVDRAKDEPAVKAEPGTWSAGLDLLKTLPLSAMFDASLTQTKTAQPGTQNGTVEFPQQASLFLAGAWTEHLGSFVQLTYTSVDNHFSWDNTDIRYARITTLGGKELVWGLDLNNNPTVEDLWNTTPAWGYPWVGSDSAPTPAAATMIQSLGTDVAGGGGYMMWNDHLYLSAIAYRTAHLGGSAPNTGEGFQFNSTGVAPYWRLAWQQSGTESQFEIGTYGMYMKSTPNSVSGPADTYTDIAGDLQWDLTIARHDVLSLRGTYIHQSANLAGTVAMGGASVLNQDLSSVNVNAEYHFGNRVSATFGWFDTWGTADAALYPPGAIGGSATGSPNSDGFIANLSWWPTQNLQVSAQYTGYTKFNGGTTDYDGSGRNASDNNTFYLLGRFIF